MTNFSCALKSAESWFLFSCMSFLISLLQFRKHNYFIAFVVIKLYGLDTIIQQMTDQGSGLWPIFYSRLYYIFWWNNFSLNILEHFEQRCFPSKLQQKCFTSDKISAWFSFYFEEREGNISCEFHQNIKLTFSKLLKFCHPFHTFFNVLVF